MSLVAELPDATAGARFVRTYACPQCGDRIVSPAWSEHVSERCVRHYWCCDACNYEFETSIYLPPGASRAA